MKEIKLIKLVTSEEVVTTVTEETDTYYMMEKPRLCAMRQAPDGNGGTGNFLVLLPWMMYASDPTVSPPTEKDVKLFKNVIAGEAVSVPKVMEDEYLAVTSTIQLVT